MNKKHLLLGTLSVGLVFIFIFSGLHAQSQVQPQAKGGTQKHSHTVHQSAQPQDEGERVFQQNCARCHTPPDGFSTRISGTIVRHMRVRANLSQDDERAILRFFNP